MSQPPTTWLPPRPEPDPARPMPRPDALQALEPLESQPPIAPGPPSLRDRLRRFGGPLLVVAALLFKFGKAALLFLPKAKVLTTSLSALVSVAAYSLIWGWRFALGFVVLLFVHEMGHVIQLRREGVEASAPLFIPFLGAVVGAKSLGDDAAAEARVGLAGPVLGTLGAAALIPVAEATGNDLFNALAYVGFLLNLFNLLPLTPLDGGRAFAAMAPWMWFVGLGAALVLVLMRPNPILLLIVIIGGLDTFRRWKAIRRGDEETRRYYKVRPAVRFAVAGVYLALLGACALGMDATYIERTFDDV